MKSGVVPSVFSFKPTSCSVSARRRTLRAVKRNKAATTVAASYATSLDVSSEIEVSSSAVVNVVYEHINDAKLETSDVQTQCLLPPKVLFSVDMFKGNCKVVKYYTGFESYEHFMFFFNVLGPCVNHLLKVSLSAENQLFMTVIKLKQAKDDIELSIMFGVCEKVVSKIFVTWVNFLYCQLKEINFWPSKCVVRDTMPQQFNKCFPSTRVIVDATEIPIQKPAHVNEQSATFSTYKNRNTLKVLVGCTPRGLVSYVSDGYGGRTSDRQICERSALLKDAGRLFDSGDSIMADRGFNVQDLFATKNVFVNIPTFLRGKSQLVPADVVKDKKIASKRIHIERVIGLAKTYKILRHELSASRTVLGSRIIYVCFMLCNFRKCIVKANA